MMITALAVSGCSGGNSGSSATPTPTPSQSAGPSSVSQIFNLNNLHAYAYHVISTVNGQTSTSNISISYMDTTYNGIAANHTVMTLDTIATNDTGTSQMIVDIYTSKEDDRTLGCHMKLIANGQTLTDKDIPADQASSYTSNVITSDTETTNSTPLTNTGTETINVNGKSYTCTKYIYKSEGDDCTIWYTPQAPMPVKILRIDGKGSMYMMELISWN